MLLGKRPRPPVMRRTTSMSDGLAVDTQTKNEELMSDSLNPQHDVVAMGTPKELLADQPKKFSEAKGSHLYAQHLMGTPMTMPLSSTTSINHRHTHNLYTTNTKVHTSHFLRTCGLCNCHLAPGRDIYMYRGDTAFCSLECREKQMKQDQRKEKWKAGSNREHRASAPRNRC